MKFLIVSHGQFIREFMNAFNYLKNPEECKNKDNTIRNLSVTILKISSNFMFYPPRVSYKTIIFNDNSHLSKEE